MGIPCTHLGSSEKLLDCCCFCYSLLLTATLLHSASIYTVQCIWCTLAPVLLMAEHAGWHSEIQGLRSRPKKCCYIKATFDGLWSVQFWQNRKPNDYMIILLISMLQCNQCPCDHVEVPHPTEWCSWKEFQSLASQCSPVSPVNEMDVLKAFESWPQRTYTHLPVPPVALQLRQTQDMHQIR